MRMPALFLLLRDKNTRKSVNMYPNLTHILGFWNLAMDVLLPMDINITCN